MNRMFYVPDICINLFIVMEKINILSALMSKNTLFYVTIINSMTTSYYETSASHRFIVSTCTIKIATHIHKLLSVLFRVS